MTCVDTRRAYVQEDVEPVSDEELDELHGEEVKYHARTSTLRPSRQLAAPLHAVRRKLDWLADLAIPIQL